MAKNQKQLRCERQWAINETRQGIVEAHRLAVEALQVKEAQRDWAFWLEDRRDNYDCNARTMLGMFSYDSTW